MNPEERPNRIPWPPILYAAAAVGAAVLHWLLPLTWFDNRWIERLIGVVLAVVGFALAGAGFMTFRRIGTPVDPTAKAETLVTTGVYAWTRNPMYSGMMLTFLGLSFALGAEWLFILAVMMGIALQKLAIGPEERHLEARFGDAWRAYAARVRGWL